LATSFASSSFVRLSEICGGRARIGKVGGFVGETGADGDAAVAFLFSAPGFKLGARGEPRGREPRATAARRP
jgi:hypothetical protein